MSQENLWLKEILIIVIIGSILGILIMIITNLNNNAEIINNDSTKLNWNPEESIHINYAKCKDLNRSLYINRLFKKDFRLPMCPERYVVLYDKSQEIVFIFNEELHENPTILSIDVTCDNSSGKC